jgi:NADH-quinone oxidoreductase subunit M
LRIANRGSRYCCQSKSRPVFHSAFRIPRSAIEKMFDEYAVIRVLVLLLVLVPLAAAALVPVFGRAARRVSLVVALAHLGLSAAVVITAAATIEQRNSKAIGRSSVERFRPEFIPGGGAAADYRTGWTLFRLSANQPPPGQPGPNVQLFLGVDGLNAWLVALASVMMVVAVLASWEAGGDRPGAFFGWLFLLQAGLVGCFLSFDVILFYAFFELTLIPAFFLIGRWGLGSGRRDAARKFFLYTLAGSLLMLVGLVGVVLTNPTPLHPVSHVRLPRAVIEDTITIRAEGQAARWVLAERGPVTFSLPDLMGNVQVWANARAAAKAALEESEAELADAKARNAGTVYVRAMEVRVEQARGVLAEAEQIRAKNLQAQFWFFIALMAGFMVKVPVWPFHTWLPAAYGEAPPGVALFLSGVMAKLGTFGILRLVLPLVPDAAIAYGLPVVGALAAVGIVYAAFCAFASRDARLLVAYSSVSHLGFLVLGLFAFNREGLTGAALHMVNHGLSTGMMFAAMGVLWDRYRTTEIPKFGGLMGRFPAFAVLTFVGCLASIGLPGLNNFVSEMMMMAGLFGADNPNVRGLWPAVVAVVGIFLSAWYTLTLLQRVFFNPLREPQPAGPVPPRDLNRRELYALGSLAALCLALGLWPQPVIDTMRPDVQVLANIGDAARARARGVPYAPTEEPDATPAARPEQNQKGPPPGKGGPKGGAPKGGNKKGGGKKGGPPKGPPGEAEE